MDRKVKINICGMTNIDNISRILFLEPDYLGFIFYPKSPRYVVGQLNPDMLSIIPPSVKRTGVFVNASEMYIRDAIQTYGLSAVQMHGSEKPRQCARIRDLGVEVIKAFHISDAHDFESVWDYTEVVDYYLFDTKSPAMGGTGKQFDWQLILRQPLRMPWILSGGIGPDNIAEAAQIGATMIDLNSRFESAPGIKDYDLLNEAISKIDL